MKAVCRIALLAVMAVLLFGAGCAPLAPPPTPVAAGKVYVANEDDNTVSVIDVATQRVMATIAVEEWPHCVALSPDGKLAYVTKSRAGSAPPSL